MLWVHIYIHCKRNKKNNFVATHLIWNYEKLCLKKSWHYPMYLCLGKPHTNLPRVFRGGGLKV